MFTFVYKALQYVRLIGRLIGKEIHTVLHALVAQHNCRARIDIGRDVDVVDARGRRRAHGLGSAIIDEMNVATYSG